MLRRQPLTLALPPPSGRRRLSKTQHNSNWMARADVGNSHKMEDTAVVELSLRLAPNIKQDSPATLSLLAATERQQQQHHSDSASLRIYFGGGDDATTYIKLPGGRGTRMMLTLHSSPTVSPSSAKKSGENAVSAAPPHVPSFTKRKMKSRRPSSLPPASKCEMTLSNQKPAAPSSNKNAGSTTSTLVKERKAARLSYSELVASMFSFRDKNNHNKQKQTDKEKSKKPSPPVDGKIINSTTTKRTSQPTTTNSNSANYDVRDDVDAPLDTSQLRHNALWPALLDLSVDTRRELISHGVGTSEQFWNLTDEKLIDAFGKEENTTTTTGNIVKSILTQKETLERENWRQFCSSTAFPEESKNLFLSKTMLFGPFKARLKELITPRLFDEFMKVQPSTAHTAAVWLRMFCRIAQTRPEMVRCSFSDVDGSSSAASVPVSKARDKLVSLSGAVTSASAAQWFCGAIYVVCRPSLKNKLAFMTKEVVQALVDASHHVSTVQSCSWFCHAVSTLSFRGDDDEDHYGLPKKLPSSRRADVDGDIIATTFDDDVAGKRPAHHLEQHLSSSDLLLHAPNLLECEQVKDAFLTVSRFVTSHSAAALWTGAIHRLTLHTAASKSMFGRDEKVRDAFIAIEKFSTSNESIRQWCSAVVSLGCYDTMVRINFISATAMRDALISVGRKAATPDCIRYLMICINDLGSVTKRTTTTVKSNNNHNTVGQQQDATVSRSSPAASSSPSFFDSPELLEMYVDVALRRKVVTTCRAARWWCASLFTIIEANPAAMKARFATSRALRHALVSLVPYVTAPTAAKAFCGVVVTCGLTHNANASTVLLQTSSYTSTSTPSDSENINNKIPLGSFGASADIRDALVSLAAVAAPAPDVVKQWCFAVRVASMNADSTTSNSSNNSSHNNFVTSASSFFAGGGDTFRHQRQQQDQPQPSSKLFYTKSVCEAFQIVAKGVTTAESVAHFVAALSSVTKLPAGGDKKNTTTATAFTTTVDPTLCTSSSFNSGEQHHREGEDDFYFGALCDTLAETLSRNAPLSAEALKWTFSACANILSVFPNDNRNREAFANSLAVRDMFVKTAPSGLTTAGAVQWFSIALSQVLHYVVTTTTTATTTRRRAPLELWGSVSIAEALISVMNQTTTPESMRSWRAAVDACCMVSSECAALLQQHGIVLLSDASSSSSGNGSGGLMSAQQQHQQQHQQQPQPQPQPQQQWHHEEQGPYSASIQHGRQGMTSMNHAAVDQLHYHSNATPQTATAPAQQARYDAVIM